MNPYICTYYSLSGNLSVINLRVAHFKEDEEGNTTHVQGITVDDKPITLRFERIIETHDSVEAAVAHLESVADEYKDKGIEVRNPFKQSSEDTMDICFTGFAKKDKEELSELATQNQMFVRQSVTKHLDILCYGYNAGPKKLEQALDKGIFILNRSQFERLVETGEVPESVEA